MCSEQDPLANFKIKVTNGNICFFRERDWSQECCYDNNIEGVILFLLWTVAKGVCVTRDCPKINSVMRD